MYKLYTTYVSNMKKIPQGIMKAIIMRFPLAIREDPYTKIVTQLSPKSDILLKYKKDKDWEAYTKSINRQMDTDPETIEYLNQLQDCLDNNNDVCLICCEKDYLHCHRSLIGERFKFLGYEWQEL